MPMKMTSRRSLPVSFIGYSHMLEMSVQIVVGNPGVLDMDH